MIVEPVFAAGGVVAPAPEFFDELRHLCDETGMLLIVDESATGFGRTGHLFGSFRVGAAPDLVVLAKALSGGYLPLGALLVSDRVFEPFARRQATFHHGSSSAGNPLSTAAALGVLDLVEGGELMSAAVRTSEALPGALTGVRDLPVVSDVRVVGAMAAVDLDVPEDGRPSAGAAIEINEALIDAGVVTHVKRNRISFFPPLTTSPIDLIGAGDAIRSVLSHQGEARHGNHRARNHRPHHQR